jgi:hypothetical protein
MSFTVQEQERMDALARRIADILWGEYPGTKGRYVWENAYHSALELVLQINHPGSNPAPRMMVVPDGGKPHEESPDCRAAGCIPAEDGYKIPLPGQIIRRNES